MLSLLMHVRGILRNSHRDLFVQRPDLAEALCGGCASGVVVVRIWELRKCIVSKIK